MNNSAYKNNLDLLRLIFATIVVFHHLNALTDFHVGSPVNYFGRIGVYGFFIISGYVIAMSFDRDDRIIPYAIRRLFRIYPLLLVALVIQVIFMVSISTRDVGVAEIIRHLIANILLLNFLSHAIGDGLQALHENAINGSLWTLKIEMAFYVVLPVLWMLVRRFGGRVIVLTMLAGFGFLVATTYLGESELAKQIPSQMVFFGAGMLMHHYRVSERITGRHAGWAVLAALAVTLVVYPELPGKPYIDYVVLAMALSALVAFAGLGLPSVHLRHDVSYGVYLIHFPVIQALLVFGVDSIGMLPFYGLVLAITFSLAWLSALYLEEPAVRAGRRLVRRWQDVRSPAPVT